MKYSTFYIFMFDSSFAIRVLCAPGTETKISHRIFKRIEQKFGKTSQNLLKLGEHKIHKETFI